MKSVEISLDYLYHVFHTSFNLSAVLICSPQAVQELMKR